MGKKIKIKAQRPWIGYPGSTVQQNYAEELSHGFLLWEIEDRDHFDVQFHELPNPKPFITITWQGSIESTVKEAQKHPHGARFRIRNNNVLTQKDVVQLTSILRQDLHATEVTFKNDHQVNRDIINTGTTTLAKDDLRNPDVLLRLLKDYHRDSSVDDVEWEAIHSQVGDYLQQVLGADDVVRNTKWTLRDLQFDNTYIYGSGNRINFEQLNGIVGIFGPNRSGKSSIVGTIMYALHNTTDRGNVKNLHVVNARQPYCYTKAIVNVAGTNYIFERQTVKHESKRGTIHAGTALNVFKIDENGEIVDLAGEQRNDTEKVLRNLIGSSEDCLLTSIAAQDDVKLFINQGSSKRRKDLSRFLDLDIFDKMYDLAKFDVNANKAMLRNLPDRDWNLIDKTHDDKMVELEDLIKEKDHLLNETSAKLHDVRTQLATFKDFTPVTKSQVETQELRVNSLTDKLEDSRTKLNLAKDDVDRLTKKFSSIETVMLDYDLSELKKRLEAYRTLESSFESLRHVHEKDLSLLKQQERSLKILDDVPCGDTFPTCKFIKDAFKNKERIEPQRDKVSHTEEKLQKVELALQNLKTEKLLDKITKIEQLTDLKSKLRVSISNREIEIVRLETSIAELENTTASAIQLLAELKEAQKNEENVEVVSLRNQLDELQRVNKRLDSEKLHVASEIGRVRSDYNKLAVDRKERYKLLQLMKAHELIAQAFSRRGIPSLIVSSQLPLINAEISQILTGIVDFNIELVQDDDSDSMEVYIDYGDSKRIIELGSGMEKTIAALAIRVALINVSSLPKTDMFIIDESFGPLDPASVEACNRLLVSLKRYFKTIIVITHVEGVKDIADHILEVQKVEKDAKIVYNESWTTTQKSDS